MFHTSLSRTQNLVPYQILLGAANFTSEGQCKIDTYSLRSDCVKTDVDVMWWKCEL